MVTLADVKILKAQELKDELKALGLDTTGLKAVLATRLEEALKQKQNSSGVSSADASASVAQDSSADPVDDATLKTSNGRTAISYKANEGTVGKVDTGKSVETNGTAATDSTKAAAIPTTVLSEEEKRKQRAERFGLPASIEDKKAARAERFGLKQTAEPKASSSQATGIAPMSEADKAAAEEKKKERAKRFNLPLTLSKEEIDKQKKARLERFGGVASKEDSAELQSKLAARAERFALKGTAQSAAKPAPAKAEPTQPLDPEAEAKRKAREIKFSVK